MALLVSSLPLSLTTIFGLPRSIISRSSSRATRMPESEVSATSARHSRVQSSHGGQDAEAAAVGELIRHEVERPAVVGRHRNHHRRPGRRADGVPRDPFSRNGDAGGGLEGLENKAE